MAQAAHQVLVNQSGTGHQAQADGPNRQAQGPAGGGPGVHWNRHQGRQAGQDGGMPVLTVPAALGHEQVGQCKSSGGWPQPARRTFPVGQTQ